MWMWWNQSCVLKVCVTQYDKNYDKEEQHLNHWIFGLRWHVYKCSFGDNILIFFLIRNNPYIHIEGSMMLTI